MSIDIAAKTREEIIEECARIAREADQRNQASWTRDGFGAGFNHAQEVIEDAILALSTPAVGGYIPLSDKASSAEGREKIIEECRKTVAATLAERANYFQRTATSHWDREDQARSYTATAREVDKALVALSQQTTGGGT